MGEATATETTRFCPMCAAPLRPRAVFCHRCGKPFPEEAAVIFQKTKTAERVPNTQEFEQQWEALKAENSVAPETEELATQQEKSVNNSHPPEIGVVNESEKDETDLKNEEVAGFSQPAVEPERTADKSETVVKNVAQKPRVKHRVVQTTEYVWEESASDPTWKFALATVVILVFVLLVLWFGRFIQF